MYEVYFERNRFSFLVIPVMNISFNEEHTLISYLVARGLYKDMIKYSRSDEILPEDQLRNRVRREFFAEWIWFFNGLAGRKTIL